ncbi:MAG: sigma factor-like helix-turn-helix DNA-binding protein [Oscillospiraceae bacterium]
MAERLHVSESMVKSRISRTLKKLREYLRKEGYDL